MSRLSPPAHHLTPVSLRQLLTDARRKALNVAKMFSGYYAAFFTETGESFWDTPQRLYEDDFSEGRLLWHKSGNYDVSRDEWDGTEGWYFARPIGSKLPRFIAHDKDAVAEAIKASRVFREALAHALFPKAE